MLAKWGVPSVIFAGWLVAPAVNLGGDEAEGEKVVFKYAKGELGELPTVVSGGEVPTPV